MKQTIRNLLIAAMDLAFIFVFVWFFLAIFTHGRFVWVNMANMFAFPIFVIFLMPLMLIGLLLNIQRAKIMTLIGLGMFVFMFGGSFVSRQKPIPPSADVLRVMTFNMLVYTPDVTNAVNVIRDESPDIVMIQETSFAMADALDQKMKDLYPYQIHNPSDIPIGLSVISKYPFEVMDDDLGDYWVGTPIPLEVNWNGQIVHIVDFHMYPTTMGIMLSPEDAQAVIKIRREKAVRLVEFVQEHPGPVILAGDANDVWLNDTYITLVNSGLQDAWAQAGSGLGHTFPGNKSPGTSRLHIAGVYIPEWMVRIDYIFASPDWEVLSAKLGQTDGYSDHRPVIATLRLRK